MIAVLPDAARSTLSSPPTMRVLCTGDLHIGRRSTRLPASVAAATASCASAWSAIVDHAIDQGVDVVAISGDLVDQTNRFYESLGPLERGLRRLRDASIPVVAVAGNHDHDVLPELARVLPPGCLTLLGVGGTWERLTIKRPGGERLHVDGWSFPRQHVTASPLVSHVPRESPDAPVLGLLHADLDAPASLYAPVSLAELRRAGGDLWLLGHVHAGHVRDDGTGPCVLYPGSPHPMDPGEPGAHGVWIVQLTRGQRPSVQHVPLACVRYDAIDVDLTDVEHVGDARLLIVDGVRSAAERMFAEAGRLRHLSLRVRLTGRCSLHRVLDAELGRLADDLQLDVGAGSAYVELVENGTRPRRDLEQIAAGNDAPAVIARVLRDLERADGLTAHPALERALREAASAVRTARAFESLATDDAVTGDAAMRAAMSRQASFLLDELLSQQEGVR